MEYAPTSASYNEVISLRRNFLRDYSAEKLPTNKQFVWEIGCGHGHFLTAYAQLHPEHTCIGVDIESSRIERACRKRDRSALSNLHFVHGDARLFLEVLPEAAKFAAIFILFPDPWPKLRHHKHRIMQPDFLTAVARRAGDDTRVYFRTDYEPYFSDTQSILHKHPDWEIVNEPWLFEHETVFQNRAKHYHSLVARRLRWPTR